MSEKLIEAISPPTLLNSSSLLAEMDQTSKLKTKSVVDLLQIYL